MSALSGPWVCSVCGSSRIQTGSVQASLGDSSHPLGLCWDCRGTQDYGKKKDGTVPIGKPPRVPLSPLCRPAEFHEKQRRAKAADPEDLFGALSEGERRALARPINGRPVR